MFGVRVRECSSFGVRVSAPIFEVSSNVWG